MSEEFQYIRGLPFPNEPFFKRKNIEETLDYIPRDGDVIVASYPKTGSTWLENIVLQIICKDEKYSEVDGGTLDVHVVPFLELSGLKAVEKMVHPRIYKHHYPYNMVQKNENSKYLYIYRKPEDALVSFYHFSLNFCDTLDFNDYFESFLSGQTSYSRYFEHILSYLKHKNDQNLLLVSYEKLHKNRRDEILRIAKYLNDDFYHSLLQNGEILLKDVIEKTNFEYMQKTLSFPYPDNRKTEDGSLKKMSFFRKGIVGDGESVLSTEQLKTMRDTAVEVMKGTDVLDEWYKE